MFPIIAGFDARSAACNGVDLNVFFPTGKGGRRPRNAPDTTSTEAQQRAAIERYCNVCPVKDECLELALFYDRQMEGDPTVGVWGGTTDMDRRVMRAAVSQVA